MMVGLTIGGTYERGFIIATFCLGGDGICKVNV